MVISGQILQDFSQEGIIILNIRTDNAIKNHFYSKLRKFIRKILKNINKDGLLKSNGIDPNKYNSDKIYKMIKKFKVPYNSLTKESVLAMINNFEKNSKNSKFDTNLLKNKITRRKSSLYTEKIKQRKIRVKQPINTRRSTRTIKRKVIEEPEEPEIKSNLN
jgi:hypothetical protein